MTAPSIVPQSSETATEAMARVHAEFWRSVQRQLEDPRVTVEELTPGDVIRHAGEWHAVVVKRDDRMHLSTEDGRREWVHPTVGETWLRFERGY